MKPSGFSASKCMQNILWRRTMFAVTLEQQKSLQSILSHRRANGCQFIIGYSSRLLVLKNMRAYLTLKQCWKQSMSSDSEPKIFCPKCTQTVWKCVKKSVVWKINWGGGAAAPSWLRHWGWFSQNNYSYLCSAIRNLIDVIANQLSCFTEITLRWQNWPLAV